MNKAERKPMAPVGSTAVLGQNHALTNRGQKGKLKTLPHNGRLVCEINPPSISEQCYVAMAERPNDLGKAHDVEIRCALSFCPNEKLRSANSNAENL